MALNKETLEKPVLGRPVELGMMYDCRNDSLIHGLTLWDNGDLKESREESLQRQTQSNIISSDNTNDKMAALNIDDALRASLLADQVKVGGSAEYMNDKKTSSRHVRVTLQYKNTVRFEKLNMKHLGRQNVQCPHVFEKGLGTHVITGIVYGVQAFFVFERLLKEDEKEQDVQTQLKKIIDKIKISLDERSNLTQTESEKEEINKCKCKFYGDSLFQCDPGSYIDITDIYSMLPSSFEECSEYAVPLTLKLYPLTMIDSKAAQMTHITNTNAINYIQTILEGLDMCMQECAELVQDTISKGFSKFTKTVDLFKTLVQEYKNTLQKRVAQSLQEIRAGETGENVLLEIVSDCEQCPFRLCKLVSWLKFRENEISVVKSFMKGFRSIQIIGSRSDMNDIVHDFSTERVVAFSFTSVGLEDGYLNVLSNYTSSATPETYSPQPKWYECKEIQAKMRTKAKQFKEFANWNKDQKECVFVVLGFDDEEEMHADGASILLYELGQLISKDCSPLGAPRQLNTLKIGHDYVMLQWATPCVCISRPHGYIVKYREITNNLNHEWSENRLSSGATSATIHNLKNNTPYEFLVEATYKKSSSVQFGATSDTNIATTLPSSIPGMPEIVKTSHETVKLRWTAPEVGLSYVEAYLVKYRQLSSDHSFEWAECRKSLTDTDATIVKLRPNTTYEFSVEAISQKGNSLVSAISETNIARTLLSSPPGKPHIMNRYHDSVQLEWTEPNVGRSNVKAYMVKYRETTSDHHREWSVYRTSRAATNATIVDLIPNALYEFAVAAKCENEDSNISAMSDIEIAKTFPSSPPGRPCVLETLHDSVKLQWAAPQVGLPSVQAYLVKYREKNVLNCGWSEYTTPATGGTIIQLRPNALYEFSVEAISKNKESLVSAMSKTNTARTLPSSPPGKPHIMHRSHDSVQLKWIAPKVGRSHVTAYMVKYRETTSDQNLEWSVHGTSRAATSATIIDLIPNTSYEFVMAAKCEKNDIKSIAMSEIEIVQTLASSPPGRPEFLETLHDSVKLRWTAPSIGLSYVQAYIVKYRHFPSNQGCKWSEYRTSNADTDATLVRLTSNTEYEFSIGVISKHFDYLVSAMSETNIVKTLPMSPPGKPQILHRYHDSVKLEWTQPKVGRSHVKAYIVKYRETTSDHHREWSVYRTSRAATNATIVDLIPNTSYEFGVAAKSKNDDCDLRGMSDIEIVETLSSSPPGRPEIIEISHDSVKLQWREPQESHACVDAYIVKYREKSRTQSKWSEFRTLSTTREATIYKLRSNAAYEFSVGAMSKNKDSLVSMMSETNVAITLPSSSPGKPHIMNRYHDSVQLKWTAPKVGHSHVKAYMVKYRETTSDQNREWSVHGTSRAATNATIVNLIPNTSYEFAVAAKCETENTESIAMSDIEVGKTLFSSPPGRPEILETWHDSVKLRWAAPQVGLSSVQAYIVKYRQKTNQTREWFECRTSTTATDTTIRNLRLNAAYEFSVVAISRHLDSLVSAISETNTAKTLISSPPMKPRILKRYHDSLQLEWTAPKIGFPHVTNYVVKYRETKSDPNREWSEYITLYTDTKATLTNLKPNTKYEFSVAAKGLRDGDNSRFSQLSEVFQTFPSSPPQNLRLISVTSTDVNVIWTKPSKIGSGLMIHHYQVLFMPVDDSNSNQSSTYQTKGDICMWSKKNLTPGTTYRISVSTHCGTAEYSAFSNLLEITTHTILLHQLTSECNISRKGNRLMGRPFIYNLPLSKVPAEMSGCRVYQFGKRNPVKKNVVVMVVGATGAGKSTLINGIVNYIFNVAFDDDFRFKIIDEVEENRGRGQSQSQTDSVTSYTIYPTRWSIIDYTLTIIDTPGFGDTRGIDQDKAIVNQIKEFFSCPQIHHVNHIDAICFVAQASLARLTVEQRYVFDSILAVFGKDVEANIMMLLTFADGQTPPALAAISEARLPNTGNVYKFNNSALYADKDQTTQAVVKMFWDLGIQSMKKFFFDVSKKESKSLLLTQEVLKERERLETAIEGLQLQIKMGCARLNELTQEQKALKGHEADIQNNQNFSFEVTSPTLEQVSVDKFTTNCTICNFTCHYPCTIKSDSGKGRCKAMRPFVRTCSVCPGKCKWELHSNQKYVYKFCTEKDTKTYEDIKSRYQDATNKRLTVQQVIKELQEEFQHVHANVFSLIKESHDSLQCLEKIALRPNPLSTVDYVDLLIETETREASMGWKDRVRTLEDLRESANLMTKIKEEKEGYNPFPQQGAVGPGAMCMP